MMMRTVSGVLAMILAVFSQVSIAAADEGQPSPTAARLLGSWQGSLATGEEARQFCQIIIEKNNTGAVVV
ncbi:MAG: hypothetical protein V3T70_06845, partial [Phycisphaerae bacterium]